MIGGPSIGTTLHSMLWCDPEIDAGLAPPAEISALLRFESALAQAQARHGLVTAEAAAAIAELCGRFQPDISELSRGVMRDGMVVPDLVRQLRIALPESYRDSLHFRSTSQDAIDTALVLRLKHILSMLSARLDVVIGRLVDLEGHSGEIRQMARTRMQRALPTTAGQRAARWREPLVRHRDRIVHMLPHLLVVQYGGPIGTDPSPWLSDLAELLELGTSSGSWHTTRDSLAELASWLSLVTGSAGKIGIDIAMMAQNEIGEAKIAGGGQSSAMHHKSNPVQAELLVAIARWNAGQLGTIHQSLVHEQERSGAAWTLEWMTLPGMLSASGASLSHLDKLLSALTFQADRFGQ